MKYKVQSTGPKRGPESINPKSDNDMVNRKWFSALQFAFYTLSVGLALWCTLQKQYEIAGLALLWALIIKSDIKSLNK